MSDACFVVIPSGSRASPLRTASSAPARLGVLVSAPASRPASKPDSSPASRDRTRARVTAVRATTAARATYFGPSARKALKKLGPAWRPTEKMKMENPKVAASGRSGRPR